MAKDGQSRKNLLQQNVEKAQDWHYTSGYNIGFTHTFDITDTHSLKDTAKNLKNSLKIWK